MYILYMFRLHFTTYGFCYACLPNSEKGKGFVLRQGSHLAMLNLSSEKYTADCWKYISLCRQGF